MNGFAKAVAIAATTLAVASAARAGHTGQAITGSLSLDSKGSFVAQISPLTPIMGSGTFAFADA